MNLKQRYDAFLAGTETAAYEFLGAHPEVRGGKKGYCFRVWAPHAQSVHVTGDFCSWDCTAHPMNIIPKR